MNIGAKLPSYYCGVADESGISRRARPTQPERITPTLPIAHCKNYLVKMTTSEGYAVSGVIEEVIKEPTLHNS